MYIYIHIYIYIYIYITYSGTNRREVRRNSDPPFQSRGKGLGYDIAQSIELAATAYIHHIIGTYVCVYVYLGE
jgi:hypothetical protein